MITEEQYFTNPTTGEVKAHSDQHTLNFIELQARVENLLEDARIMGGYHDAVDPDTGTQISGVHGGSGDGGFRLPNTTTGAPMSNHRKAKAVDIYDPVNVLDIWLNQFDDGHGGNSMLLKHGLAREHPDATPGWCHLQSALPSSGRRTFNP